MFRTIYQHTNSNGYTDSITAEQAILFLLDYDLNYYSFAEGRDLSVSQDMMGGRVVHVVACKLDDGTAKGSWLSANAGTATTAGKIAREWRRAITTRKTVQAKVYP